MSPELAVTETGHHIWDSMAIEHETGEFLFAVVRATKPRLIVESGTGNGVAASFLASALVENGQGGRLVTFEPDPGFRERAAQNLAQFPAEVREGTSAPTDLDPDLVFVDCHGSIREPVIRYWLAEHPGSPLVIVHDAKRPYPFELGTGVHLPGWDGLWVGRPNPPTS